VTLRTKTLFCLAVAGFAFLAARTAAARNTDVSVDSSELGGFSLYAKKEEDKFGLRFDDTTTLGFNEDGDPALSRQF